MASQYKIEVGPDHVGAHLKIYLKNISQNQEVQGLLEGLNAVDHVNITPKSGGKSDLTLYPNKAYDIQEVKDDVASFLDKYFDASATVVFASASSAAGPVDPILISNEPIVFISYSWDNQSHQDWVLALADKLQMEGGVRVLLDQYDLRAGKNLAHFMEKSVAAADKVVMIMTPDYKLKADGRQGGVGYEYSMITAKLFTDQGTGKFIPVARVGKYDHCSPTFIASLVSHDMTDDKKFDEQFVALLRLIHDEPYVVAPLIGTKPIFPTRQLVGSGATPSALAPSPVVATAAAAAIILSPLLIDDVANMAKCRMPHFAHWRINIKLNALSALSLVNLHSQLIDHRIAYERGTYLPWILNDTQKRGHYPDVDYAIELKSLVSNMLDTEVLKITKGHVAYEYAEYSDHDTMLLRLNQPFITLFYLLLILKAVHAKLSKDPVVEVEVKFNSNRKAMLYLQYSPIPVGRVFGMQSMIIPDNASERHVLLETLDENSLFDLFQEIYSMFMAENPSSNMPYVRLDKTAFEEAAKTFFNT